MKPLYEAKTKNLETLQSLFSTFAYDTIIDAVIHGYHGDVFLDDLEHPSFGMLSFAGIVYVSGSLHEISVDDIKRIIMPGTELHIDHDGYEFLHGIGIVLEPMIRYDMDHRTLNRQSLEDIIRASQAKGKIVPIDKAIYRKLMKESWAESLVENYPDEDAFVRNGLGYVVVEGGEIVSGTSSFARFTGGHEIEIVTRSDMRNQGYATLSAAYFILSCMDKGWIPHWDAANPISMNLAMKLGYRVSRAYQVYRVIE